MSALAPEQVPTSGAAGAPTDFAVVEQDWLVLQTWWAELTMGRRRQLLTLTTAQPLPPTVAADLGRRGIRCPLILVGEGTRVVRRAIPSLVLLDFLAAHDG